MHNMVKEAFLLIMMVTIAALMYFVLFGSWDNDGFLSEKTFIYEGEDAGVGTTYNGSAKGSNKSWQGVLWYAARVIENPIAFYYYNYCLTPNVHGNDYLDMELGCQLYGHTDINDISVQNDIQDRQEKSVVSPDEYTHYPDVYNGPTTSIPDFSSTHYHFCDSNLPYGESEF